MEGGRARDSLAPVDGNYADGFFACRVAESEGDKSAHFEVGMEG